MGSTEENLRRWWLVVVGVVLLVLAGAGSITWSLLAELRSTHERAIYDRAEQLRNADGIGISIYMRAASARGYLLSGDRALLDARAAAHADIDQRIARLLATARGDVADSARALQQLVDRIEAATDRAIAAYAQSPAEASKVWDQESRPLQGEIEKHVAAILAAQRTAFDEARDAAADASASARQLLAWLLVAVAIVIATLAYAYARALRSLVTKIEEEQQQVTFRLIEQVPVGIFVIRPDGRPYYANQHAKMLLGRGIEPGTYQLARTYRSFEIGTERPYPEERLPIRRALAGEIAEVTDIEVHRDDDVIPLHVVAAPVHDARGKLIYAVAGFQDVRELQRVAMRDALTGLVNRGAVQQMFTREHLSAQRSGRALALALVDLDRFKSINDNHGHAAGDDVLRKTAATLVATFRRTDVVGRWGGEEIVVVMPDSDLTAAARGLERALEATRAQVFRGKDDAPFSVTFSAGVVVVSPQDRLDTVIARADALLYAAKEAGRNRVVTG